MLLSTLLGSRKLLPTSRKLKVGLLAVVLGAFGLYALTFVSFTSVFRNTWQHSLAAGYFVRSATLGFVETPVSANIRSIVRSDQDSTSSQPWLFPVNENETNHRIVEALNVMVKYASENRTGVSRKVKYILRIGDFNWEDWIEGQDRFINDKCPVKDCHLTSDFNNKSRTADALLISKIGGDVTRLLPKPAHQIWIARTMESPAHNRIDTSVLRGLANWTVNYRHSATISIQYYVHFLPKDRIPPQYHLGHEELALLRKPYPPTASYTTVNFAKGKTKKIAWFVSNCGAGNGRQNYANELNNAMDNGRWTYASELSRHIPVDIFGGCGQHNCVKEQGGCRKMLSADYKFYLAFENSNCVEYITEKVGFQALSSDTVPIVMGARPEDYARLLPPDSYIHVDDFKTPRDLADYLLEVDKNDTLYNSYFRWRDSWTPVVDSYWCRLCFMLHYRDDVGYVQWYDDFTDWWNGACSSRQADDGQGWRTWRPEGFWNRLNVTSVHRLNLTSKN